MFRVENRVGRLVELTIRSPLSEDEVRELAERELADHDAACIRPS